MLEEQNVEFFFIESICYSAGIRKYLSEHPGITGVVLLGFKEKIALESANTIAVRRPLYILNLAKILAHEDLYEDEEESDTYVLDFIAPDAKVLVVDDNQLNLTVAEGLIAPLQIKVDKALSGRQAISIIGNTHYDVILMDHMMPELDGIETTRIIRRFHEDYNMVPIIALTANVVEEVRSMFLVEGMNDFIAKPIESKVIIDKLREWLPNEKIQKIMPQPVHQTPDGSPDNGGEQIIIPELDTRSALRLLGNNGLYRKTLQEYVAMIPRKSQLISQYKNAGEWKKYTIETHALKSSSRQIGAIELSELAARMEQAGNAGNIDFILSHHEELLEKYLALEPILSKHVSVPKKQTSPKSDYDAGQLLSLLDEMQDALDELNMDEMGLILDRMEQFSLDEMQQPYLMKMRNSVDELDAETCELLISQWQELCRISEN